MKIGVLGNYRKATFSSVTDAKQGRHLPASFRDSLDGHSRETNPQGLRPDHSRDSDQKGVLSADHSQASLMIRSESKTCPNVFFGQFGKISENGRNAHSSSEILEHVGNGDSHATDTWLTAALSRLNRDNIAVVHTYRMNRTIDAVKAARPSLFI